MYLPAAEYRAPVVAPYALSVEGCTVAELMSDPAVWAVVVKHMPSLKIITTIEMAKPQLGNMTIADFGHLGGRSDTKAYAALDAELKQLPPAIGKGR
jgi:hypothetical protein